MQKCKKPSKISKEIHTYTCDEEEKLERNINKQRKPGENKEKGAYLISGDTRGVDNASTMLNLRN
jgi:hypothetical protein